MINFERARLEYILQKESEVTEKEKNVHMIVDCSNKNEKLTLALNSINKIIGSSGISQSNKTENKNNNIVKGIENIITGKIDSNIVANPEQLSASLSQSQSCNNQINTSNLSKPLDINQVINQTINTNILSEVPMEHIIKL